MGRKGVKRNRAYCFTYFPKENVEQHAGGVMIDATFTAFQSLGCFVVKKLRYLCMQAEVCPTTQKLHYQGYFQLEKPMEIKALVKDTRGWFDGIHFEVAKGTASENRAYCSKPESGLPGTFREFGQAVEERQRTDLTEIAKAIVSGKTPDDIASSNPDKFILYFKGLNALHTTIHCAPRRLPEGEQMKVYWFFGPTGTGKSKYAFERYPNAYLKMNNKWWDGYRGEKEVIMDDYRPNMCPFNELLRIVDRHPMRVEAKGMSFHLSATTFVITTCARPEVLWISRTNEQIDQLLRRITEIWEFPSSLEHGIDPAGQIVILKSCSVSYVMTPSDELELLRSERNSNHKDIFLN